MIYCHYLDQIYVPLADQHGMTPGMIISRVKELSANARESGLNVHRGEDTITCGYLNPFASPLAISVMRNAAIRDMKTKRAARKKAA